MIASVLPVTAFAAEDTDPPAANAWKYGLNGDRGFNENTFATIERNTDGGSDSNWRDGSMTGNGTMGLIESCDPAEDVIIYNDTRLVLGTNDIFEVADVAVNIDEIRKTAHGSNAFTTTAASVLSARAAITPRVWAAYGSATGCPTGRATSRRTRM